ncbi:MAG TPA: hypothetical protein VF334_18640 [Polyangia bacterium]
MLAWQAGMRSTAALRIVVGSALALGLAGCDRRGAVDFQYTLFADDAQIASVDHDGQPWCMGGADPEVSVVATLGATVAQTSEQPGLTPSWREPLVDADLGTYRRGVSIDVTGRCDGASFFMGRALMHPDAAMVQSRGVALGPIGNVTRLRLHFAAAGAGEVGDTATPAFGYGDDDYGWYDPSADDPGYDWGDAPPDPGDDGSGDPGGDCGCSDDGSSDPGGGDSGGDSGGDFRRVQRHGGAALTATRALRRR